MVPNAFLHMHTYNTFVTPKSGTSLRRTNNLVPMRPLFGGSTVYSIILTHLQLHAPSPV